MATNISEMMVSVDAMLSENVFMSFECVDGNVASVADVDAAPANGKWFRIGGVVVAGRPRSRMGQAVDVTVQPIEFTKETDDATVGLMCEAFYGAPDKHAVIVFCRHDAGGTLVEHLRLDLKDCVIVSFDIAGGGEGRTMERYLIHCGEFTISGWEWSGTTRGARSSFTIVNEVQS